MQKASLNSIAFTQSRIDRQSELRSDTCIDEALDNKKTKIIVFIQGAVVAKGDCPLLPLSEAENFMPLRESMVLLGYDNNEPVLAVFGSQSVENIASPYYAINLRLIYSDMAIAPQYQGMLAQGFSVLNWHSNNRYCPRCGGMTHMRGGGVRRYCEPCQAEYFPRVDPVAIMLVHEGDFCLLARNTNFPEKRFSCLAGFIEQGETFETAVRREVKEETDIDVEAVRYCTSQPWPFPNSLMLGGFAKALHRSIVIDQNEITDARWFNREEVGLMLEGLHPDSLTLPPAGAIASFLIRLWYENK